MEIEEIWNKMIKEIKESKEKVVIVSGKERSGMSYNGFGLIEEWLKKDNKIYK